MISSSSDPTQAADPPAAKTRVRGDDDIACGEFLRRARQRRGLTLQQVAESTKIPLRHLDALEHDEFGALPGGMYRRAHVRAYAAAVGLDQRVALARLDRGLEDATPPAASGVHASEPSPPVSTSRSGVSMIGGAAAIIAVMALVIWVRQPAADGIASSPPPVPPPASSVRAPHAASDVVLASSGSSAGPASTPVSPRTEPGTPLPLSHGQAQTEPSDSTTTAASAVEPQLTVITEPAGARVTVNGIGWGITPVTIKYLDPGAKRVRVTHEGYRSEERVVQIDAGPARTTVRIPMRNEN